MDGGMRMSAAARWCCVHCLLSTASSLSERILGSSTCNTHASLQKSVLLLLFITVNSMPSLLFVYETKSTCVSYESFHYVFKMYFTCNAIKLFFFFSYVLFKKSVKEGKCRQRHVFVQNPFSYTEIYVKSTRRQVQRGMLNFIILYK